MLVLCSKIFVVPATRVPQVFLWGCEIIFCSEVFVVPTTRNPALKTLPRFSEVENPPLPGAPQPRARVLLKKSSALPAAGARALRRRQSCLTRFGVAVVKSNTRMLSRSQHDFRLNLAYKARTRSGRRSEYNHRRVRCARRGPQPSDGLR